jgi:light-regulated signal transduction histidine kinase (bacteriophytochrome)
LKQLCEETIRSLEPDTGGRNIRWSVGELPVVQGDRAMLRQVFANLLGNAVKYTRDRSPAEIEIGSQNGQSDEDVVFVRDNGAGFDMQHADKLFGVFQRLHTSEEFEGTGIGLANVNRIVGRHGGRCWAEAVVGVGATFYFSFPKVKPK